MVCSVSSRDTPGGRAESLPTNSKTPRRSRSFTQATDAWHTPQSASYTTIIGRSITRTHIRCLAPTPLLRLPSGLGARAARSVGLARTPRCGLARARAGCAGGVGLHAAAGHEPFGGPHRSAAARLRIPAVLGEH